MNTVLRSATAADIPRLLEIQRLSPEAAAWSESDYRQAVAENGRIRCLIAERDGVVAGFLVYRDLGPAETELLNLAVDPARRRTGIGRRLVISLLRGRSGRVFLEVRASNGTARRFYRSIGFAETGRRPGYYRNPPEDAVLMERDAALPIQPPWSQ